MAFPNFFKNYFYGRSDKKDFTEADLPANRFQLFREVLSVRRGSMTGLNLLYLLCWLPAIFWTFLNLVQLYLAPTEDAATLSAFLEQLVFSYLLVLAPLIALTGPFNMGASFVMRNWARDEHSFVLSDFKDAMKENWRQGLIFGAISGLVLFVTCLGARFYLKMAQSFPAFYLPLAILLAAAVLWYLTSPLLPTMFVTYRQGFFAQLRNALLMTLVSLPKAVAVRLATLALPIAALLCACIFPSALGVVCIVIIAFYATFGLAFVKLLYASYANAVCEKYLNSRIEGARINIGLRNERKSEE